MSLENTRAKYEVEISRVGDGANQAAADFQKLDTATQRLNTGLATTTDSLLRAFAEVDAAPAKLRAQEQATAAAAAAARTHAEAMAREAAAAAANRQSLTMLRTESMLLTQSMREISSITLLFGGTKFAEAGYGVAALSSGLRGLRSAAVLSGLELSTLAPVFAALVASAAATAIPLHEMQKNFKMVEDSEASLIEQSQTLSERLAPIIERATKMGMLSPDQAHLLALGTGPLADVGRLNSSQHWMSANGITASSMDALEKYKKLQEEVHAAAMDQFEKERYEVEKLYQERLNQISDLAKRSPQVLAIGGIASDDALVARNAGLAKVRDQEDAQKEQDRLEQLRQAQTTLEQEITMSELNGSRDREGYYDREFDYRVKTWKGLRAQGIMTEQEYTADYIKALQERQQAEEQEKRQAFTQQAQETQAMVRQFEQGMEIEALQSKDSRVKIAEAEYQQRIQFYGSMYMDYRIDEDQMTEYANQAQLKRLQMLNQSEKAEKLHVMTVEQMEAQAANQFSSGMAQAIVEFAEGTKSAEAAFRQFATTFLTQIAEMIIQQEILNALKAMFFAGGGTAFAAAGGFFPTMAASGLEGVSSVSSPTYFPRFNVVAGEAGREMLTVLARPRFMEVGGLQAVVGQAGRNTLAITNANQLAAAQGGGGANGHIVIEIQHSQEAEARIISSSVAQAEVRVTQQMTRNSRLRDAVKQIQR